MSGCIAIMYINQDVTCHPNRAAIRRPTHHDPYEQPAHPLICRASSVTSKCGRLPVQCFHAVWGTVFSRLFKMVCLLTHLQEGWLVVWLVSTVEEVVACIDIRLVVGHLLDRKVVHHLASLGCDCLQPCRTYSGHNPGSAGCSIQGAGSTILWNFPH